MQVNSTSSTNSGSQTGIEPTAPSPQTLSQADFLKLLVAQMTSQDPLNPTDSQDLLTQTVQLSTLQSNTTLQSTLTRLQNTQNLTQAGALLGRQVTLQADPKDPTTLAQGIVTGVEVVAGSPMIVVNGTPYDLSQVISISTPTSNP